jgi:hypothetical protein
MKEIPLLSPLLPPQLILATARALGWGGPVLQRVLQRMTSKASKPKVFAHYEPTEHDVFVTCFSKSGTNWAMQLAVQTMHLGAAEFDHIHDLVAWPESRVFPGMVALDDPTPWQQAPAQMRAIKTAFEAAYVPYSAKAKYLCVARDPKEIHVSAYHFLTGVFGMRDHITPEQWFDMVLEPGSLIHGWAEHMASYWAWRDRPNVLILLYPEMKKDLAGTVDKIAGLLNVTLDASQRSEVIRKCEFDYMKSKESCFAPPRMAVLTGKARGKMIRSGKTGDADNFLTPTQRDAIDTLMRSELERLGSEFPYEALFMQPSGLSRH